MPISMTEAVCTKIALANVAVLQCWIATTFAVVMPIQTDAVSAIAILEMTISTWMTVACVTATIAVTAVQIRMPSITIRQLR